MNVEIVKVALPGQVSKCPAAALQVFRVIEASSLRHTVQEAISERCRKVEVSYVVKAPCGKIKFRGKTDCLIDKWLFEVKTGRFTELVMKEKLIQTSIYAKALGVERAFVVHAEGGVAYEITPYVDQVFNFVVDSICSAEGGFFKYKYQDCGLCVYRGMCRYERPRRYDHELLKRISGEVLKRPISLPELLSQSTSKLNSTSAL